MEKKDYTKPYMEIVRMRQIVMQSESECAGVEGCVPEGCMSCSKELTTEFDGSNEED